MTCRFPVLSRLPTGSYFFAPYPSIHLTPRKPRVDNLPTLAKLERRWEIEIETEKSFDPEMFSALDEVR